MKVSVFGGSQPKEGSTAYAEAQELGKLLAERGHTVLTGGYIGTMEAVSRGAREAGLARWVAQSSRGMRFMSFPRGLSKRSSLSGGLCA